jgi:hypothetical protein
MQKVVHYKIVSHADISEVEVIVNEYLKEGYELCGYPFAVSTSVGQAIVKSEATQSSDKGNGDELDS